MLPIFYLPVRDVIIGVALVAALGLVAGILPALQASPGRVLGRWREAGWGEMTAAGKARGAFGQELVDGAAEMIRERWPEAAAP